MIVTLLKKQRDKGKTVLVVHHDLSTVAEYFDWTLLLNTRLVACGPLDAVFTQENVEKAFSKDQMLWSEAVDLSARNQSGTGIS